MHIKVKENEIMQSFSPRYHITSKPARVQGSRKVRRGKKNAHREYKNTPHLIKIPVYYYEMSARNCYLDAWLVFQL